MKLDPGMHIGMHLVSFGKSGVTAAGGGGRPGMEDANMGREGVSAERDREGERGREREREGTDGVGGNAGTRTERVGGDAGTRGRIVICSKNTVPHKNLHFFGQLF
jgi:hypothetical protein